MLSRAELWFTVEGATVKGYVVRCRIRQLDRERPSGAFFLGGAFARPQTLVQVSTAIRVQVNARCVPLTQSGGRAAIAREAFKFGVGVADHAIGGAGASGRGTAVLNN